MNDTTNPAPAWTAPPTAEQTAAPTADAASEQKKLEREQAKAAKEAAKNEAKEAKEAAKAARKAEAEEKKARREAAIAAKNELKAAKMAEKEKTKQPEQNGIRRPKPEGECGKAWALFDRLSQAKGAPVAAAEIRAEMSKGSELNEGNVKAEYPRWKKFHGLSGMIAPAAPLTPTPATQPTATPAAA
jgi:hypothetical protein